MFIRRPADRTIQYTYVGNPIAMPPTGSLGIGDTVKLETTDSVLEAHIVELLSASTFRGTVTDVEHRGVAGSGSSPSQHPLVVGASLQFEACHVFRCTRGGI